MSELAELHDARFDFPGDQEAGDVVVFGREVDGFQRAEEVDLRHRATAEQRGQTRRAMLGCIVDRQTIADDEHRFGFQEDGCGFRLASAGTDQSDHEHEQQEAKPEAGEEGPEGGGEDRLEKFFHGMRWRGGG